MNPDDIIQEQQKEEKRLAQLEEKRKEAQKYTREMSVAVLPSATTECLKSAFAVVELQRSKAEAKLEQIAPDKTEEEKEELGKKALTSYLEFQKQVVEAATMNIRHVVWTLAGLLTADYFPDLIDEEKKRQANQAKDVQTSVPGIGVSTGDSEVATGEDMPESQGSSETPRSTGFRESPIG